MSNKLKDWKTSAAQNNASPPFGWPEGMAPSAVNNTARQDRASIAEWYADPQWVRYDHPIVSSTSTTVVITGDVAAAFPDGRAVRLDQDPSKVGYVSGAVYSAPNTTVTITGLTVASPTVIEVGAIRSADALPSDVSQDSKDYADAIARRDIGATYLNGIGAIQQLTGSGNFTVPAGVYRLKVTATGGGGGGGSDGGSQTGSAGSATTFGSLSAGGGGAASKDVAGVGAAAPTGGDVNLPGGDGQAVGRNLGGAGGASFWGGGSITVATVPGTGGGGRGDGGSGGAGATIIKVLSVAPGDVIAYSVGAGGAGATGGTPAYAGAAGTIIVEY
jgi:hypothetical protein